MRLQMKIMKNYVNKQPGLSYYPISIGSRALQPNKLQARATFQKGPAFMLLKIITIQEKSQLRTVL